jgi:hypothetical protein
LEVSFSGESDIASRLKLLGENLQFESMENGNRKCPGLSPKAFCAQIVM